MPQFPISDQQGIIDGLNYALSGPSGLGQDFAGFSSSGDGTQFDMTGNYRPPYAIQNFNPPGVPTVAIYVAPIPLGTSEMLDERTWKFTFASPVVGLVPFVAGQPVTVSGVADPYYDGTYSPIGVVECTDTYVTVRTEGSYPVVANSSGGTVELNSMDTLLSTDCNAKVTVTSALDRVVISSQLNNKIIFDAGATGSIYYEAIINRYKASSTFDPVNPDYRFNLDGQVAYKQYLESTVLGSVEKETIFTSIIDSPGPGYYWYILEVRFTDNSGGNIVTNCVLSQRSFSAQVVKQ